MRRAAVGEIKPIVIRSLSDLTFASATLIEPTSRLTQIGLDKILKKAIPKALAASVGRTGISFDEELLASRVAKAMTVAELVSAVRGASIVPDAARPARAAGRGDKIPPEQAKTAVIETLKAQLGPNINPQPGTALAEIHLVAPSVLAQFASRCSAYFRNRLHKKLVPSNLLLSDIEGASYVSDLIDAVLIKRTESLPGRGR